MKMSNYATLEFHILEELVTQPKYEVSTGMIVLYTFLFVFLELLGNFLLICMVHYEKYGMDPQKRTVTNQLLSSICVMMIFFNVIIMPFIFGPVSIDNSIVPRDLTFHYSFKNELYTTYCTKSSLIAPTSV